ncbi:MAG: hypothetical protein ABJA02_14280 [Acidobacteriota bacterium]
MKWSVLGVLAVFLAQAGVIAYTAIDRESNAFVAANSVSAVHQAFLNSTFPLTAPDPSAIAVPRVAQEIDTDDSAVATVERRKRVQTADRQFAVAAKGPRAVRASNALFKPRIITVDNSPRIEHPRLVLTGFASNEIPAAAQTVRHIEKRSILSKSVSIIKKPYDWLKAVGSSLR